MELTFEKWEDGRWFVILPEWDGLQEDLEMVDGADTFLDFLTTDGFYVTLDISLDDQAGYSSLEMVGHDQLGGTYRVNGVDGFDQEVWLCNVVHFIFGEHPETIYFKEYKGGKYTIHIMIKKIFDKVVDVLMLLADKFHTTYNAVNIVVYYCLIPLFWAVLLDYKLGTFAFSLAVLSFWAGIFIFDRHFVKDCDYWFEKSVAFLEWFKKIGWNYKLSSVIICVVLPIILTVILLF